MTKATGTFEITSLNEDPVEDRPNGGKLSRAWGDQIFSGDITGDGAVQWVALYRGDKTARLSGSSGFRLGRRAGRLLRDRGHIGLLRRFVEGRVDDRPRLRDTGDLAGISGSGSFEAAGGKSVAYELEYTLSEAGPMTSPMDELRASIAPFLGFFNGPDLGSRTRSGRGQLRGRQPAGDAAAGLRRGASRATSSRRTRTGSPTS